MEIDELENSREFNNKFPSKFYICSNCGYMTNNPYTCQKCKWRADGLFKTMGNGYKFKFKNSPEIHEIFKSIELER